MINFTTILYDAYDYVINVPVVHYVLSNHIYLSLILTIAIMVLVSILDLQEPYEYFKVGVYVFIGVFLLLTIHNSLVQDVYKKKYDDAGHNDMVSIIQQSGGDISPEIINSVDIDPNLFQGIDLR
jgi:hypothetical protein